MDGHPRRSPLVEWLRAAVTENLGLKVTSLLIALALFGMVRGAGIVTRSIEVGLVARLPPASARRVLLTDLPNKVTVTARGPQSLVGTLRADDLGPVQVDLSDGRKTSVTIDRALFQVPGGVQVEQVDPASIALAWDTLVERDVPVRAEVIGSPAPGARLQGTPEVAPTTVHVEGPGLYVNALPTVRTEAVDITGLGPGAYERTVALAPPRRYVRYDMASGVRVTLTIDQDIIERRFERIPVTPVGSARVVVRPPVVTVVLRGSPQAVNAVIAVELVPTIELGEVSDLRGSARRPVQLVHVPAGTELVAVDPSEVIVTPAR
jgi:hypothetical protein